ncbi:MULTISPECIES: molecular chaperone TorD [Vibrio]|uniref:Chaperone protein TorD n=1 Tax=Vibrio aestuarianus TaxID=28171 RepID=A0AAX3U6C0_9VIBR|nr:MULTISPECIES: molecular chaperone TorD [Vibrio]KOE82628.1 molecular chaperone TorD [Vibrio alginolyticus]MDE1208684.1 molecular chaperone TorD [Vibrio aestuarianus]MDE1215223.1 molecular chaperone TorD [Vibrio aestuarianus]MDE1217112.1 molecular chaperone TorD [Vibrio aestuarianus]MDE1219588.1 molecular chaperone TorD [Vibrio aestuarianus]
MQETKAFNEKRAEIYWWLSSLFVKELTEQELEQYHTQAIRSFLTGLGDNQTLKPAIDKLVDALNRLMDREDAQLELAADFCDVFLKSNKDSALPYASIYIGQSGLLNAEPAKAMTELMASHNIAVSTSLNEPADHIAIELDFLGNLIIRSNELEQEQHLDQAFVEQYEFIQQHILSWVPQFSLRCQQIDQFGFYSALTELLVAFLQLDCKYLSND